MVQLQLRVSRTPRPKVIVVSHERSGTHFLMNTLAANFGYVVEPFINLDFELGLNFHSPDALGNFFLRLREQHVLNLTKSHHSVGFYDAFLPQLADAGYQLLYIHRDPRDVMLSFWRFLQHWNWDEGPRTDTIGQFLRAAPRGNLLRYQKEQWPSMVHRWQAHVQPWRERIAEATGGHLHVVDFADLSDRFEDTVAQLAEILALPAPATPQRPDPRSHVVLPPGVGPPRAGRDALTPEDLDYLEEVLGGPLP